jgi:maltose O-acetyltransferase
MALGSSPFPDADRTVTVPDPPIREVRPSDDRAGGDRVKMPFIRRLARAARRELSFDFRAVAAHMISRGLPQFAFNWTRTVLLRATGISIGSRSTIMGTLYISGSGPVGLLSIGEDTAISGPLRVDLAAPVHVGNRVHFGQGVVLLTVDHEIGTREERCARRTVAPIWIGNGVWIASRVTILPGVSVGHGAVVATGAVVTADVPPDTLVGGVPARVVRHLDQDSPTSVRRRRADPMEDGD